MSQEIQEKQRDNNAIVLDNIAKALVPWWRSVEANKLHVQTELSAESYLNGFYLFPLQEFSVSADCDDIPKFINQRFQVLLAAASASKISVMLVINSNMGKTKLFLGLKREGDADNSRDLFESILNGIIPGKRIKYDEKARFTSFVSGYNYGGMVTGVPAIMADDEKHRFNISSVIRALYEKDYTLTLISNPISEQQKQNAFGELISLRDTLHSIAKQTIGNETGIGKSLSENNQQTSGISNTSGNSVGGSVGVGIPTPIGIVGGSANYSHSSSKAITESNTKGETETISVNKSQSLSIEQQNGIALELEKIADQYIDRFIKGFNSGLWETSISFASRERISCEIIGGSFLGELAKPNDRLLPPPRLYIDTLGEQQKLFVPKTSSSNPIFPKILSSYITSEELSLISSSPTESVPGYEIKKMPALALTDTINGEYLLGNITDHGNPIENSYISLSRNDLNKHLFVCGLTGSGKTTTVKHILKQVTKDNIPFLILESAKRDYRQLLADEAFKNKLRVFTIGDSTVSPLRLNPFYIQNGVHPLVHIDYLKAIFNASFSLYGPMPHIVEKCLHRIYTKRGWNLTTGLHPHFLNSKNDVDDKKYKLPEHYYFYPTLNDLKDEIEYYIENEMDYKGELRDNIKTAIIARIESLCVGAKGLMFNTYDFYSIEDLLQHSTIFEMENLADDDDKAFFVGLILVLISEYRQKDNPAINPGRRDKGLQHFLVIEEAHRLLKNVSTERSSEMMGNPKGKAVEVFCNVISEMRSLGQGVAVVEQIPGKISPDVIKNSNTKIVHRLVSKDDQALLAGSLSISDEDALYLNRLTTGHALCHKEGMERPVECCVINDIESLASHRVSQKHSGFHDWFRL